MSRILIEIVPALIGFSIAAFFLIRYAINKDRTKIIIATFAFLVSGFIVQISITLFPINLLIKTIDLIKKFADNYHNIFSIPIVTFVSTALGIFAGNKMLRFFLDGKEKREISVLLTSSIDRQVINLGFINLYASPNPNTKDIACTEIYQSEFDNDEPFKVAFNRIGIYQESEIKLISDYYVQLRQCLNYIKRYLLEIKNNNSISLIYKNTIISLLFTQLSGILCVYKFSINYSNSNKDKLRESLISDYHKIIDYFLKKEFYCRYFCILNTKLTQDIINRFKNLRKEYRRANYLSENNEMNSIYLCRVSLNQLYSQQTVCSQTNNPMIQVLINKNDDIVTFGNSKEESKEKCVALIKDTLKTLLSPQQIDDLLNQQEFELHIISL